VTESLRTGVSVTAVVMAQDRRVETDRPDGLVSDPLAAAFVDAAAGGLADSPLSWVTHGQTLKDFCPAMGDWVALRTRYLDNYALDVVRHCDIRQIILPAAGLDTRAFRLAWPAGTEIYEIDMPELIAFKDEVLAASGAHPRCTRTAIPADLRSGWAPALLDHGFRSDRPSLWLIEGLLMYLDSSERLMREIGGLAATGSRLALDHSYSTVLRNRDFAVGRQALAANSSSLGETVDQPEVWLRRHGWDGALATPESLIADTNRELPPILDPALPDSPIFWMATATRV
jgi:methyltransferase (TIGR00027 family)